MCDIVCVRRPDIDSRTLSAQPRGEQRTHRSILPFFQQKAADRLEDVVDKLTPVITLHSLRGDVYSFASHFAGQSGLFESQISVYERFKPDQR